MQFYVNIILVKNLNDNDVAKYLDEGATRISGSLFAIEGDIEFIDVECESIDFDVIDENVIVGSLGGLTEVELKEIFCGYADHF